MKSRDFTLICIAGRSFVINRTFISGWTYVTGHNPLIISNFYRFSYVFRRMYVNITIKQ